MYIFTNALRCIGRSKGRNLLIGLIVLVIAVSSCLGLSIRRAADTAKKSTLENMTVSATITFDRTAAMQQMSAGSQQTEGGFDKGKFKDMMGGAQSLTLDEYNTYAAAASVKDFYYTSSTYVNGNDSFAPVSTQTEETGQAPTMGKGQSGGGRGGFGMNSDFLIFGVSSEQAMTEFLNSTAVVNEGTVFEQNTENYDCIISQELADFNSLSAGSTVTVTNPNDETEAYELSIVGIYTSSAANESSFSRFGATSSDPANKIYMSADAVNRLTAASADKTADSPISSDILATYLFEDIEDYESFEDEVRALGLDEKYTVSSSDVSAFEDSILPLETLGKMAGYFLIVILLIGALILIVLNIFNIRERKYEIGVLCAMGMKKGKVAIQFITEIFTVTILATIIGATVGAVASVPVTNSLLESQITAEQSKAEQIETGFGRGERPNGKGNTPFDAKDDVEYIDKINSAADITVILQMIGIGIMLTIAASAVSILFVMRYEPLKILANRD